MESSSNYSTIQKVCRGGTDLNDDRLNVIDPFSVKRVVMLSLNSTWQHNNFTPFISFLDAKLK